MATVHSNGYEIEDWTDADVAEWNYEREQEALAFSRENAVLVRDANGDHFERHVCVPSQYMQMFVQLWPIGSPNVRDLEISMGPISYDDFLVMWNYVEQHISSFCSTLVYCEVDEDCLLNSRPFWNNNRHAIHKTYYFRGHLPHEVYVLETSWNDITRYFAFAGGVSNQGPEYLFPTELFVGRSFHTVFRNGLSPKTLIDEQSMRRCAKIPYFIKISDMLDMSVSDGPEFPFEGADSDYESDGPKNEIIPERVAEERKVEMPRPCMWYCEGYSKFWLSFDNMNLDLPDVCDVCHGHYFPFEKKTRLSRLRLLQFREKEKQALYDLCVFLNTSKPMRKIWHRGGKNPRRQMKTDSIGIQQLRDKFDRLADEGKFISHSYKKRTVRYDGPRTVPTSNKKPITRLNRQKALDTKREMKTLFGVNVNPSQPLIGLAEIIANSIQNIALSGDSQLFIQNIFDELKSSLREGLTFLAMLILVLLIYKYKWERTAIALLFGIIVTRIAIPAVFIDYLREILDSLSPRVMCTEMFSLVPKLLLSALTIGFVNLIPKSDTFDRLTRRLDHLPKALVGLDRLGAFIKETYTFFSDWIKEHVLNEAPRIKLDGGKSEIDAWIQEIEAMAAPDVMKNIQTDHVLVERAINIHRKGLDFMRQFPNMPRELIEVVKTAQFAAKRIYDAALQTAALSNTLRAKPVCVLFLGNTSVGKTGAVYPLALDIGRSLNLFSQEDIKKDPQCWNKHVYARAAEQEFWDGYNQQEIIFVDDAFQRVDDISNPNPEIFELIRMGNLFRYYLHMASLHEKSNTAFNGRVLLLTSNDFRMNFPSIVSKEAIISRITHPYQVELKDEYKDETGRLDVRKARAEMTKPGLNLNIYQFQPVRLHATDRPTPIGEPLSYFEMMRNVCDAVKESVVEKEDLDRFMTEYGQMSPDEYQETYCKTREMKTFGINTLSAARSFVRKICIETLESLRVRDDFVQTLDVNMVDVSQGENGEEIRLVPEEDHEYYLNGRVLTRVQAEEYLDQLEARNLENLNYDTISIRKRMAETAKSWLVGAQNAMRKIAEPWKDLKLLMEHPDVWYNKHPTASVVVLLGTLTFSLLTVLGVYYGTKKAWLKLEKFITSFGLPKSALIRYYERIGHDKFQLACVMHPSLRDSCNSYEDSEGCTHYVPDGIQLTNRAMKIGSSVGKQNRARHIVLKTSVGKQNRARKVVMATEMAPEEAMRVYFYLPEDLRKQMVAFIGDNEVETEFMTNFKVIDDETLEGTFSDGTKVTCQLREPVMKTDTTSVQAQYKANHNHWHLKYLVRDGDNEVLFHAGMSVAIGGRIHLVPYHFYHAIRIREEKRKLIWIKLFNETNPDGIPIDPKDFLSGHRLVSSTLPSDKQKDAYLYDAGRTFGQSKSLLRTWCKREEIPKVHGFKGSFLTRAIIPNRTEVINYMHQDTIELIDNYCEDGVGEFEGEKFQIHYASMLMLPMAVRGGDCGAVLSVNNPKVIGKHCGILTMGDDYANECYFTPVCVEELKQTLELFGDEGKIVRPDAMKTSNVREDVAFDEVRLPKGNFTPIGLAQKVTSGSKSALAPSLLHNTVIETFRKPALLRPTNEHDPLWKGLEKCGKPVVLIDSELIEIARKDVAKIMDGATAPHFNLAKYKRVLTFEESVKGWDGDEFVNSITRSTSPGYPWVLTKKHGMPGKTQWFGKDDEYDIHNPECDKLRAICADVIESAKNNERYDVIFTDTLKDELRPIEKVNAGKTRVFSAGPMHYTIVARQYFLGYCAWAQHHRVDNQLAVGIRPFELDWQRAALKLQSRGVGVVAGDFENYDGTESAQILWAICDNINEWYDDGPENARIRRVLFAEIAHGIHIADGNVYQWNRSLPSGNPFTAIFNSIYNIIAMRVVWLLQTGRSLMDFNKNVWMIAYGDDNVVNLSSLAEEIFDQKVMTEGFLKIGMIYTDETKTGTGRTRKLEEVSFLKRSFVKSEELGKIIAPLNLQTVLDQTNWIRTNENAVTATAMNVAVCVRELSLHGRAVFDHWYPKIVEELRKRPNLLKETKIGGSYADYLHMWKSGELDDMQWF